MEQTSEAARTDGPLLGPGAPSPDRRTSRLRHYLTVSWVVTIVAFTILRFVVAKGTLEEYGLNVWVFGAIDLITAVPYAIGVARVVGALVDRNLSAISTWASVAAFSFMAPYLYIAWAGRTATFPREVYVALVVLIVIFGGNAILGVRRKVRRARVVAPGDHPVEGAELELG